MEGVSGRQVAVLFDVDGTLAETERDGHRVAFNQAFAEAGLDWHWDERLYGELLKVTGGKERIACYATQSAPAFLAQPDADRRIAMLHARKNSVYAELVARGAVTLRPGVPLLFDSIERAGWQLGIVTTTSRANVTALLDATLGHNALARFAVVVCGEDVARKKPDPEAYCLALQRLPASSTAIAVEDTRNGLLSALGAGIATVIVRSVSGADDDVSGAAAVFDGYASDGATHAALDVTALRRLLVPDELPKRATKR